MDRKLKFYKEVAERDSEIFYKRWKSEQKVATIFMATTGVLAVLLMISIFVGVR